MDSSRNQRNLYMQGTLAATLHLSTVETLLALKSFAIHQSVRLFEQLYLCQISLNVNPSVKILALTSNLLLYFINTTMINVYNTMIYTSALQLT